MAEHGFSFRVAGIAIDKAFDKSFGQGVIQVRNEIKNVFTRTQEVVNPAGAYFPTPLEVKENLITGKRKIFWEGYDRSIDASLRRNAALLRLNKAPKEEYEKAKAEWKNWKDNLEPKILGLTEGQGIQFLALRGLESKNGVSLQQARMKDGRLILESQLMPFGQVDQIDSFRQLFNDRGKDISLPVANGDVDPVVVWAVQGPAIDFKQDLFELIDQAINPIRPEFVAMDTMQFRSLPEIIPVGVVPEIQFAGSTPALIEQPIELEPEKPILVSNTSSFWFEVAAAAAVVAPTRLDLVGIEDKPVIIFEAPHIAVDEEIPARMFLEGPVMDLPVKVIDTTLGSDFEISTRLDLEGTSKVKVETQTVDLEETKSVAVTVFETPIVEPMVINLEPKEKFKPLATTKQQLNDTVVEARRCFPEVVLKKTYTLLDGRTEKCQELRPTRLDLEGIEGKQEKTAVVVFEASVVKPTVINLEPEEKFKPLATTKQQLNDTAVEARCCFPETPTRLDLVGTEGVNDIQKVVFSADNRKTAALKISRAVVELRRDSKEIPIYEIKWPSLKPIKDIPEWVWQGTAAGPDEIIDWSWFLVTMFYAILNTKVLLKVRES